MGSPEEETFPLNEETVWAPPKPNAFNPKGPEVLPKVRELLFAGKAFEANRLCQKDFLQGKAAIADFLPLGTLHVRHTLPEGKPANYRRGIRLDEGIAYTTFTLGGTDFTREAFVPYNDEAMLFTYAASKPGALTFTMTFDHPGNLGKASVVSPNRLRFTGSTGEKGVAFDILAEVSAEGGTVTAEGDSLRVAGADRATLRLTALTDFNRQDSATPLTRDHLAGCAAILDAIGKRGDAAVRAKHIADFSERYTRSYITMEQPLDLRPVGVRRAEARKAKRFEPDFLLLNADFCRYLMIASSRVGGLPSTLQGKWNTSMRPPWQSDWHLDINLSMYYWPAWAWGLADLSETIIGLAETILPQSRGVAQGMLGVKEGVFLTTSTDIWGVCVPFRHTFWGMYVCGGAWLLQDAMNAYRYTEDEALLRRLLPLLREQSLFFLNWLVRHPETGKWVSGPTVSPENSYRTDTGNAAVDMGAAHDQELIDLTFRDFLMAARRLTPEDPLIARVAAVKAELAQPQIGPDGALQEWSKPYKEAEPGHRHLSFAYALMPGNAWSVRRTPALAEAVRKRLDTRVAAGHHPMGWSLGHMACLRARLNQPEEAMATLDHATHYLIPNLFTSSVGIPLVSDLGGVPAALNEMLLRSDADLIEVLPALPERFRAGGSFRLTALRGVVVEASWKEGWVTRLTLTAKVASDYAIRFNGATHTLTIKAGERRVLLN